MAAAQDWNVEPGIFYNKTIGVGGWAVLDICIERE